MLREGESGALGVGSPAGLEPGAGKCLSAQSGPPADHFFVACDSASRRRFPWRGNPLMMPSIFPHTAVRSQFVKKKLSAEAHLIVDESLANVAPYVG
jgi:hypothetical protein